ncbi:MAG: ethanolamine permease [Planctomycetes bacterium]|nr:ethanolamine permease [Planctomycetota bacterium]
MASYESVGSAYLEERRLEKSAGWALLWALGVGAVISGDFFGWNYGLGHGGFLGLLYATLAMAAMYVCMVFSIAELSAALPHAGGFYSFVRSALGPTWGYLCGVTDTIEYVLTPAAIVVSIGAYMKVLLPSVPHYVCWAAFYAVFVAINVRGAALTLKLGLVVTFLALFALCAFYAGAVWSGAFRWDALWNIPPGEGGTSTLPGGWLGVFAALPFATWFYLAIEQLPLAAEETRDVVRDMPRALVLGIATLLALSLLTLVLNTGVGGGAEALKSSAKPLADGFVAVLGEGATTMLLTLASLAGLVASFHTIIYAYGRVIFALSRAGYFPRWLSVTSRRRTPHRALLAGTALGLGFALAIDRAGEGAVGAALLNASVAAAVISYFLVLLSYIRLRVARPDLPRPYRSPLGVWGATVGAVLAAVVLAACLRVRDYRLAMQGVAVLLAVALAYYLVHSRHRLVAQAPEEAAALEGGRNPECPGPPAC